MLKNKIFAVMIALFFMFSMTASLTLIPNANAHTPAWNIPVEAFLNVAPSPVGVGQSLTVDMWLNGPPPTANGPYGDRWTGMTVKVTLPDRTTTTLGPYSSDDSGGYAAVYTPTVVGNYTFVMNFPGQTLAGNNLASTTSKVTVGDYFEPATSNTVTVTVQKQPISTIPFYPIPTGYWSRPINTMNSNWYSISGNWLGIMGDYNFSGVYNPYTLAPKTSHILWTMPEAFGGVVGGDFGGPSVMGSETSNFYAVRQYEQMFAPIILNGVLYYERYSQSTQNPNGWVAVDLQTGQTIWTDGSTNYGGGSSQQTALTSSGMVTTLSCGQLLDFVTPNQFGGFAYLWSTGSPAGVISTGTTYNMFDAMTGAYILSIVNGTSMSLTTDDQGDLIGYYINSTAGTQIIQGKAVTNTGPSVNMWNSTQCIVKGAWSASAFGWLWRPPQNGLIPFSGGIMWSAPLPTTYQGNSIATLSSGMGSGFGLDSINSGVIIMSCGTFESTFFQSGYQIEAGFSQTTGAQLWITNRTEAVNTKLSTYIGATMGDATSLDSNGIYVEVDMNLLTIWGYSDFTGSLVWGPITLPDANTYDAYQISGYTAYGTVYLYGLGGDIYAVNILTGNILWHTNTNAIQGSAGYDTPYGVWPLWPLGAPNAIADGVIWFAEGHSYSPPLPRGLRLVALNVTNGDPIWSIIGDFVDMHLAISDGILIGGNNYDNQIYAFGMGPSKTTVEAPNAGVTTATPITITGRVTDISAGSQQTAVAVNFPNGLQCVSDASVEQFMEAVYEQQPMPSNITGVPVSLYVSDSNSNYRSIGMTTTNALGDYSFTWNPDIPGSYTVYATFAGTQSYYASSASTGFFAASPTGTVPPTATPVEGLASNTTVMYGIVALVIVFIIGFAVLAIIMLRKRP